MVPETKYAKSGSVHIAYQVTGHGPIDLVFVHGFTDRGTHTLKGVPGEWRLYAVAHQTAESRHEMR